MQRRDEVNAIMKNVGLICLLCSIGMLVVFFASFEFYRVYSTTLKSLTIGVLMASLVVSVVAIIRNTGRRTAFFALFIDLAGLGAIGSIFEHL